MLPLFIIVDNTFLSLIIVANTFPLVITVWNTFPVPVSQFGKLVSVWGLEWSLAQQM